MKVDPQVRAPLPRRDAAAAPQDAAAGHDDRGQPRHARRRAAAQRRNRPASSRPRRTSTSTNSSPGWTPKRAPTCRRCWRAPAKASSTTARRSRRRSSASTRPRADGTKSPSELQLRHENIARSIHNFRLLMEALGGKDKQLAQLVDASNAVFATFAKEDTELRRARCTCCRARSQRRATTWQAHDRLQRARTDAARAAAVRASAGPAQKATKKLVARNHADHQERDPPVRARNPAGRQRTRALHPRPRQGLPEAHDAASGC